MRPFSRVFLYVSMRNNKFVHRSKRGPPKIAEGEVDPGAPSVDSIGPPDQLRKQSLVIEDYYCVSVEPADAQAAPASLLVDVLNGVSREEEGVSNPPLGQDSSAYSENEGPAQWLAAPKVDLDHGESLCMESADNTSESESE